jgi:hypothetical protein
MLYNKISSKSDFWSKVQLAGLQIKQSTFGIDIEIYLGQQPMNTIPYKL